MNAFLPDNYEVPSSNDKYMKFEQGDNRFRIMTSPILGYEAWEVTDNGKRPVRVRMNESITITKNVDPETARHFWAMVVYNYQAKRIQILEITQKSIQKTLKSLAKDDDWGSPVDRYDIVVNRSGEGMETRYEVIPKPIKATEQSITDMFNDTPVHLEALYDNKDPFEVKEEFVDPNDVPDFDKE